MIGFEQLRAVHRTRPFRPFVMELSDGRVIRVDCADRIFLASDRRTLLHNGKKGLEYLSVPMVVSLQVEPSSR